MEHITIATNDGPMGAIVSVPEGDPRGAVIVVQEAFGLTDHIADITTRLAAEGFTAIAPALFHREGSVVVDYQAMTTEDGVNQIMGLLGSLSAQGLAADLDATITHLNVGGFTEYSIGMVGFCMGGAVTLFSATRPGISAGVTFYGGGVETGRFGLPSLIELAPNLRCDWLGLYGDTDGSIPVEQVEALRAAAASAPVTTEIIRYRDAGHGFNCNDRPDHFNQDAADDAWRRTIAFLGDHLTAR